MDFDLIIVGAGPGGYTAAFAAAGRGMKTALIEKDRVGGTCLNRGCIPTKTILHTAEQLRELRDASARGLIIKNGRIAMIHSQRYHYYKFPGGGVEPGEDVKTALIREVREEAGLEVIPSSIREYGCVKRIQWIDSPDYEHLYQENLYFLCDVVDKSVAQDLDAYEAEAGFTLEWVQPENAIAVNRDGSIPAFVRTIREREAMVLELLMKEGCFGTEANE